MAKTKAEIIEELAKVARENDAISGFLQIMAVYKKVPFGH